MPVPRSWAGAPMTFGRLSLIVLAGFQVTAAAQSPPGPESAFLGRIAVVSLSSTPQGLEASSQIGKLTYQLLESPPKSVKSADPQLEIALVGGPRSVIASGSREVASGLAGEIGDGHIVEIEYEPRSKEASSGMLLVDLSDVRNKQLGPEHVLFAQVVHDFAAKAAGYASLAYATILQSLSVLRPVKWVAVYLNLYTDPAEATFLFGSEDPGTTDKTGHGEWKGPMQVGTVPLRVMKHDYLDHTQNVTITPVPQGQILTLGPPPIVLKKSAGAGPRK